MIYLCPKCKTIEVTDFISDIKRVESYPDFEKFVRVIQYGLQGFIVESSQAESKESHFVQEGLLRNGI